MDSQNYNESYHFEQEGTKTSRRRVVKDGATYPDNEGIYAELQKLRSMVAEVENVPTSGRASIDGTLMSTVFGVVLVMIISVSAYAFINLYNALVKRFTTE